MLVVEVGNELVTIDPHFVQVPLPVVQTDSGRCQQTTKKLRLICVIPYKALPVMPRLAICEQFAPFEYSDIEHVAVDRGTELGWMLQIASAILRDEANAVVGNVANAVAAQQRKLPYEPWIERRLRHGIALFLSVGTYRSVDVTLVRLIWIRSPIPATKAVLPQIGNLCVDHFLFLPALFSIKQLASVALRLVVLQIGPGSAFVGICLVRLVVSRLDMLGHHFFFR
ncbi:hypothetical protein AWV80_00240 [Cupriavidus sp. UYMU48A]|nr:hypothetical protein AWV80_00240 [Cupriavidus sp. UYMU48A]